ncbi:MAG: class D beta-lactamase [bacterium]|nr:class D beta-lactamase [bacterium]
MKNKIIILLITIVFFSCSKDNKHNTVAGICRNNKINGTIIISSLKTQKEYIFNNKRVNKRFIPASTFKIPNTLIALQEKAIKNENERIKWDGKDRGWPAWNKDHSLATAFPATCIWFYRELARRVGLRKYNAYVNKINYGNKKTGNAVDLFWLEGDIRISAREQIDFLKKIYNEKFNFKKEHYAILKKIMIVENNENFTVRGKTGWAQRVKPQIGWYVGYMETQQDVWFFACNLNIEKKSDAKYRKLLVDIFLKEKGII